MAREEIGTVMTASGLSTIADSLGQSPVASQVPTEPHDLIAWAEERGLGPLLDSSAGRLERGRARELLLHLLCFFDRYSLREVLLGRYPPHVCIYGDQKRDLHDYIRDALIEGDQELQPRRELEAALQAHRLPTHATTRALVEKLAAHRERIRETVPLVLRAEAQHTFFSDGRRPVFVSQRRSRLYPSEGTEVRIPVALEDAQVGKPTCLCAKPACTAQLEALDALLIRLMSPTEAGDTEVGALLRSAATAGWQRTLEQLDETIAQIDSPGPQALLFWEVSWCDNGLRVRPCLQTRGKRGTWLKPKAVQFEKLAEANIIQDERDAKILDLVTVLRGNASWNFPDCSLLARALVGHARLRNMRGLEVVATEHVASITVEAHRGGFAIRAVAAGRSWQPRELLATLSRYNDGPVVEMSENQERLDILTVPRTVLHLLRTLANFGNTVPGERAEALVQRLALLGSTVAVTVPPELGLDRLPADTRIVARLTPDPDRLGLVVEVLASAHRDAPAYVPGRGPTDVLALSKGSGGRVACVRRNLDEELRLAHEVVGSVFDEGAAAQVTLIEDVDQALDLVVKLLCAQRVDVQWPGKKAWNIKPARLEELRVQISSGLRDFILSGSVNIDDEQLSLAVLLDAVRADRRYVQLDDGTFAQLDAKLRKQLQLIESLSHVRQEGLMLPKAAADRARLVLEGVQQVEACESWHKAMASLDEAKDYEPEIPDDLESVLRPYQRVGIAWIARLARLRSGACLADDMGLGKTLQALAAIRLRSDDGPALVVAPTSVCFNWVREARRFAPGLTPVIYAGSDRAALLRGLGPRQLLIMSYAILTRDIERLAPLAFSTLVLDEAQAVKNSLTRRARAARRIQTDFRLALTGTPVENHLGELWSLFDLLLPDLLGSWDEFSTRFAEPIEVDGSEQASEELAGIVRPFLLRRTKREVAPELPTRTEITVDVILGHQERETYEAARMATAAALEGINTTLSAQQARIWILSGLTKLRQHCCHPQLDDPESPPGSSKITRLVEMLRALGQGGRCALVFSQFTRFLDKVEQALEQAGITYLRLDGSTPAPARAGLVETFQKGETPVFLLSLKAGGTGLNLTAADTVFHLDPWWNPAVEDQASDRSHRIGQKRPVTIYRLVARDTIEEGILQVHKRKRSLSDRILDGADLAGTLSTEELIGLIAPHAETA